jgi:2-polyprenyl-3-methyl-5-hydroxy-6-metoxy-1,4-benzoquinol methylase
MHKQQEHWEKVYQTKQADAVSWFQEHAMRSLELIHSIGAPAQASIIDVGGGASTLVDDLLHDGFQHLAVLDLSASALQVAQQRLGAKGNQVTWLTGNICDVSLPVQAYDIWHDRAVFHFLTDPADRAAYVRQVMKAVKPGGHVIVATFAPDGPEQCSGLPVARYSHDQLHGQFGPSFELVAHTSEAHQTPWGSVQHFVYCHCLKPH